MLVKRYVKRPRTTYANINKNGYIKIYNRNFYLRVDLGDLIKGLAKTLKESEWEFVRDDLQSIINHNIHP